MPLLHICHVHRFSARQRQYKYFILSQPGEELDLAAMREAAASFIGEHDFRCFCKADAQHVSNFVRRILDFRIEPEMGCAWAGGQQVLSLHVTGTAFLWHQVGVSTATAALAIVPTISLHVFACLQVLPQVCILCLMSAPNPVLCSMPW